MYLAKQALLLIALVPVLQFALTIFVFVYVNKIFGKIFHHHGVIAKALDKISYDGEQTKKKLAEITEITEDISGELIGE